MTPAALNSDGIASLLLAADESAVAVAGVRYDAPAAQLVARGVPFPAIVFAAAFALPALAAEPVLAAAAPGVFVFPLIVAGHVPFPAIVFAVAFALPALAAEPASAAVALAAVAVCVVVLALPAVVAGHWLVCSFLPMT